MNVFVSWSGERSQKVAAEICIALKMVVQSVNPWMSSDITKGKKWADDLAEKLQECNFGIVCLTRDTLTSPWILFEAGALAKAMNSNVCTLLLDLKPTDFSYPLSQFQSTEFKRDDFLKLLLTINNTVASLGGAKVEEHVLNKVFDLVWIDLENKVNQILQTEQQVTPKRDLLEMVEEILEEVRSTNRNMIRGGGLLGAGLDFLSGNLESKDKDAFPDLIRKYGIQGGLASLKSSADQTVKLNDDMSILLSNTGINSLVKTNSPQVSLGSSSVPVDPGGLTSLDRLKIKK